MNRNALSESKLNHLRAQSLVDLVPAVLHRVHNLRVPLRCMTELAEPSESAKVPPEFFDHFDQASRVLDELSNFASGTFASGPVDLERWFVGFNALARSLVESFHLSFVSVEPTNLVVDASLAELYQVAMIALHRHAQSNGGGVRIWARPFGKEAVIGLEFENASADVESLLGELGSFDMRRFQSNLVLRARFPRIQGAEEPSQPRRRSRVLLVEEVDPFGALTEKVLREAGYAVRSVVHGSDSLRHLLKDRWDLVLFENTDSSFRREAHELVLESGHPVAFLGNDGLAVPFRPRDLLEFVRAESESLLRPDTSTLVAER